ncbi:hypothetical protein VH570_17520 [Sphingobium sp. HT1-2]|uniref:hypothetical protein n=1 Tax=Sphingobium sp. HT1-2 TaxID=3111640 RepID=UPI003C05BE82
MTNQVQENDRKSANVEIPYETWEDRKADIIALLHTMDCDEVTVSAVHKSKKQRISTLDIQDSKKLDAKSLEWYWSEIEMNTDDRATQAARFRHAMQFQFQQATHAVLFKLTFGGEA